MSNKVKYSLEFEVRSSKQVLYNYIGSASGLSEWFADNVNIDKDGVFTFSWDGSDEQAKLISRKSPEHIKFQWLDDEDTNCFFEIRITIDALTKDVGIVITDFAEEDEIEGSKQLWDSQISELFQIIGA
jgi:uncharacterized protein YndB with AHSA1/START domain